jgi:hypothetical protein
MYQKMSVFHFLITSWRSSSDQRRLVNVRETSRETSLCLAAAHALVRLDDGTVVGDPMEKTTLESLNWTLGKGVLLAANASYSLTGPRGYRYPYEYNCTSPNAIAHSPSFPILFRTETYVHCFSASWR